jgi:hypothetical protein
MLAVSSQAQAWIAFGFKSGMSRFEVTGYLSDRESFVISEGERQTLAGPGDNPSKYNMVYCSRLQVLYLMRFRLEDSLEVFLKTKEKFEKRYGEPTPLNSKSVNWNPAHWEGTDLSFLWDLNESETILLTHNSKGTSAEFQDLSVCQ